MRALILDVWHDLRQKRLWPVAAGLIVAVVTVPLLLIGPAADDAGPAPSVPATPAEADMPPLVRLSGQPEGGSSTLERFKSKDPFSNLADEYPDADTDSADAAGTVIDRGEGAGIGEGSPSTGAGSTGSTPTGAADSVSASGLATTQGGSSAGGANPGAAGEPAGDKDEPADEEPRSGEDEPEPTETRVVTYEVDLAYGRSGSTKRYEGLKPLALLSEQNPRLLFLGVSGDGDTAAFSVLDEELDQHGEGRCVDIDGGCALLYLRPGERHIFVDDGDRYSLRLGDVHRVELSAREHRR